MDDNTPRRNGLGYSARITQLERRMEAIERTVGNHGSINASLTGMINQYKKELDWAMQRIAVLESANEERQADS